MEIKYQLAPTDLEALTAFVYRGTPLGWVLRKLPWVIVLGFLGFTAKMIDFQNPLTTVLPVLLFLGFFAYFWNRRHAGLAERGASTFAPAVLVISPESVESVATGRSSKAAWTQIQGFGETADHVFIMLDGVAGHVVPKRQLSMSELEALLGELAKYTSRLPDRPATSRRGYLRFVLLWLALVLVFFAWHVARLQSSP